MIMRKIEVKAYSYKEAKEIALEQGFTVVRNVTKTYLKERPVDFDEFADRMLVKNHIENAEGAACIVVMDAGSADTRERPYEYTNNVVEGRLKKKRVFEVRTVDGDELVGQDFTKGGAVKVAKDAMKQVKKDMYCRQVYQIVGDKGLAFELKYVPSANTKQGRYIVFGK
jgi:hypothetical protein